MLKKGDTSCAARFTEIAQRHATLFVDLYGPSAVKIKFHHLLHLGESFEEHGCIISAFVTERKHKDLKRFMENLFRHLERSAICSYVNQTVRHYVECTQDFLPFHMVAPKLWSDHGASILYGTTACFPCGELSRGDIVLLLDGGIGKIEDFWQREFEPVILVRLACYEKVPNRVFVWNVSRPIIRVVEASFVDEAVIWYPKVNPSEISAERPIRD